MRSKLVNLLTVYLITLAIFFPALAVFGIVWQRHLELEKMQHLACKSNHTSMSVVANLPSNSNFYGTEACTSSTRDKDILSHQENNIFDGLFTDAQDEKIVYLVEWFLFMPVVLGFGVVLYNRYLMYQAAVFQEQVEMLERLWQKNIER
jgi:hypothetical protein